MDRRSQFSAFLSALLSDDPFKGIDPDNAIPDTQGFQSPDNATFFANVFSTFRPRSLLELGSWKGTSAIMFAHHMLNYCSDPLIGCVDTWLGSLEHWTNLAWRKELCLQHGYPTLYRRFQDNVVHAGLSAHIVPLPMTTKTAIALARRSRILVDFVYVDASHEYHDVIDDLSGVWDLVGDDGIVVVDDYYAPEVQQAVRNFCSRQSIACGLFNTDSQWPEALLAKSGNVRERAVAAHLSLVDIL
jgi:predicted O-methyltransferase YrrM